MMYTVGSTTATSATLPNLQCDTEYTIWLEARGSGTGKRSTSRVVFLCAARLTPQASTYLACVGRLTPQASVAVHTITLMSPSEKSLSTRLRSCLSMPAWWMLKPSWKRSRSCLLRDFDTWRLREERKGEREKAMEGCEGGKQRRENDEG